MAESKLFMLFVFILCAVCLPLDVWAKRAAPHPVKPIAWNVYTIQTTGSCGKVKIAKRCQCLSKIFTIYEINYQKSLESDVQNLHITKLEIHKDRLIVKTEKDGIFSCDIDSGKVQLIKLPQGYEQIKSSRSVITLKVRHFIRQNR